MEKGKKADETMKNTKAAMLTDEKLSKIEGDSRLETLLEILNEQPDRYIPLSEIKSKFKLRYNEEIDQVALENSLTNLSLSIEGLPELPPTNKRGLPDNLTPHNAEHLANIAQIRQTKLIDRMRLKLKENDRLVEQDCYMITIKGLEMLNQLRLNRNIVKFNESNDRVSYAIALLTILLVTLYVIQILYQAISVPKNLVIAALALIMVCVLVVEYKLLFKRSKKEIERKPAGKLKQVIVITIFVLFFSLIIIAATKLFNWSDLAAQTTVTGLFGAYGFYVLEKYVLDAILVSNRILKYIISAIVLIAFLFVLISSLVITQAALSLVSGFVGFQFVPISQNILYEDFGGVVGSWAMYLITMVLGLKKSDGSDSQKSER